MASEPKAAAAQVFCALCGRSSDPEGPPLSWMTETDRRRGRLYYCGRCMHSNLRSIESGLQQEWC